MKVYCRVENDDYAEYETGKDNESITSSQRIKNSVYEMDSLTDSIPFTITSPQGIRNHFVFKLKYSIETGILSKTVFTVEWNSAGNFKIRVLESSEKRDIGATPNVRRTIADPCFIDFEPISKRKKHSSTGDLRVQ